METIYSARQDRPHAVFALSSRILAFASTSPPESSSLTNIYPRMAIPHPHSIQFGPLNVTQADIGNAAMKMGGGLLSGVKTLSGIAVAAARGEKSPPATGESGGFRKFFSRSAPSAVRHERKASTGSSTLGQADLDESVAATPLSPTWEAAHITVLDLQPLLDDSESGRPEPLSDFTMPSGQIVAGLRFSEDGTGLAVVPNDGGVIRVYQIKPRSRVLRHGALGSIPHGREKLVAGLVRRDSAGSVESRSGLSFSDREAASAPWHVYDLRRGRTSGVIEAVEHSFDGRWSGISTRKRTIHVFATNPYGGKPDELSHLEGRVKNVDEIVRCPPKLNKIY